MKGFKSYLNNQADQMKQAKEYYNLYYRFPAHRFPDKSVYVIKKDRKDILNNWYNWNGLFTSEMGIKVADPYQSEFVDFGQNMYCTFKLSSGCVVWYRRLNSQFMPFLRVVDSGGSVLAT